MQRVPSVKVSRVKRHRSNSYLRVKSTKSAVSVTRVKSVTSRKDGEILVVENVDAVSTALEESSSPAWSRGIERPLTTVSVAQVFRSQSTKSPSLHSSVSEHRYGHSSKSRSQRLVQDALSYGSVSPQPYPSSDLSPRDAEPESGSSSFTFGGVRDVYTAGTKKHAANRKVPWYKKCRLAYVLAVGLGLLLICAIVVAVPLAVTSALKATPTAISASTTLVTTSTTTTTVPTTVITSTIGSTTTITSTTAAATVTITSNPCTSTWTSLTMKYHCDNCPPQLTYQPLSFNYVAIANLTRVIFVLRRDAGYFGIDDVSVRSTAAPSVELLSNGGFETGTFSSWTHCVQSGSTSTGSVESTSSGISNGGYTFAALSGSYYYLGGATVHAEYLSQTFASVIGDSYDFSFAYVYSGNGSLNSGDFLLGL